MFYNLKYFLDLKNKAIKKNMPLKMTKYGKKIIGSKYSESFKVYILKEDNIISPFHEIPIFFNDNNIHVVNEIPRFENAKFEISTKDNFNPITQDMKKGKMRFVANIFPSKGYPWNYGAIPQTWEDPNVLEKKTNCVGDNDPLDVIDISNVKKEIGEIYAAKVLGCLGLIDDGECDWKIIVIDVRDNNSKKMNDISDIKKFYPNLQTITYNWFRNYKKADNKPENNFLDGGEFKNKDFAMKVIQECHESWKKLMEGNIKTSISLSTSKNSDKIDSKIMNENELGDSEIPEHVKNAFFYDSG